MAQVQWSACCSSGGVRHQPYRSAPTLTGQNILPAIGLQARRIEASLMDCLLQQWGLRQQLARLREVFLLGSPVMTPFLHSLFIKIRWGEMGV